ncbi:endonuclease domain-containing protein [Corynebacterium sp. CCUG 70398]|uniref:endonuclease domain-containing protein n=1 Tax=Corynebacterium sp. CCUG 70398 TaxID=2823891 RepID=UPI00210B8750|nr:DUF559 domain-containing protein [Corynebacterium sp. CCUG 70398]MCQ4623636.1 DUF559 domain-containing protein [Corynebacterium sp. CCUG 70398]
MHADLPMLNQLLIPIGHKTPPALQARFDSGDLYRLASRRAVQTQKLVNLKEHQRRILFALAVGQSARSSYLIGESAAALHGIWLLQNSRARVELATRSGALPPRKQWPRGSVFRKVKTSPDGIVTLLGVDLLDPVSTWLDIACTQGFEAGLVAADYLLANGFESVELMDKLVDASPCRGICIARDSLEHAIDNSQSAGESFARALLIQADIGPLTPQAQVLGPYSVDLLIGEWLIVEVDGDVKYKDDPVTATERERTRQKRIERLGYRFLRYNPSEIEEDPAGFIAEVRRALAQVA